MLQVDFDSVLDMQESHIVDVFQALSDAGLRTFLGEAISVCEPEVKEFIKNATIDGGAVISKVRGEHVQITEG
ncbi:hypothetical protein, partial [Serratia marcescens]|uniref:hypothetical protein n=1 Tax=Serratia marcescens TaxID=615 RepID=UPI002813D410